MMMMMMIIIIIIIIIIMIIIIIIMVMVMMTREILQSPHCAVICLLHVRSSGQGGIVYKSCATYRACITCSMPCNALYKGTAQLLRLTELKSHLLWLYFIG